MVMEVVKGMNPKRLDPIRAAHRFPQKARVGFLAVLLVVLAAGCNLPIAVDSSEKFPATDGSSEDYPTAVGSSDVSLPEEAFSLGLLYADTDEYKYVHPGYSIGEESGAPWGFEHLGLDLIIAQSGAGVIAPADGVVEELVIYCNPRNNQWQVHLQIRSGSKFAYHIMFEPRAPSESEVALQWDAIPLSIGQKVNQGDLLGRMLDLSHGDRSGGEPGIHFDLWMNDEVVCPEPYFEPDALAGMLALVQAMYPGAKLCYP
jgi:hypothetical protein